MIATIASFFAISLSHIPILFMLIFLIPVPFMVLTTRHNIKYGLFSLVIASLIIGFSIDIVFTLLVVLFFGPMSLAMGHLIKERKDDFTVIGIGTVISIFTVFLSIQLVSIVGGFNFINEISTMLQDTVQQQMDSLVEMDLQAADAENIVNYFMVLFPSIIIIQSTFLTLINYYVTIAILRRLRFSDAILPEFSYFKLPGNIILGSFIIMVLSYFTGLFEGLPTDSLMSNVLLIFTFIFFIQGLAFISFFLKKKRVPFVIRILIMGIVLLISPLLIFVSMLGLIDSLMDMRKIRLK